jgi:hypothetical protein
VKWIFELWTCWLLVDDGRLNRLHLERYLALHRHALDRYRLSLYRHALDRYRLSLYRLTVCWNALGYGNGRSIRRVVWGSVRSLVDGKSSGRVILYRFHGMFD